MINDYQGARVIYEDIAGALEVPENADVIGRYKAIKDESFGVQGLIKNQTRANLYRLLDGFLGLVTEIDGLLKAVKSRITK